MKKKTTQTKLPKNLNIKPSGKRRIKKFNSKLLSLLIDYRKKNFNAFKVLGEIDSCCIKYVCKGILKTENTHTVYLKKLIQPEKANIKFVIFETNKTKNPSRAKIINGTILVIPEKMTKDFHYYR